MEVSTHVMDTLRRFVFHVEQASIDEAYFDLSSCESYAFAEEIARKIKNAIREEEQLTEKKTSPRSWTPYRYEPYLVLDLRQNQNLSG
jgi:hypothetical protein